MILSTSTRQFQGSPIVGSPLFCTDLFKNIKKIRFSAVFSLQSGGSFNCQIINTGLHSVQEELDAFMGIGDCEKKWCFPVGIKPVMPEEWSQIPYRTSSTCTSR